MTEREIYKSYNEAYAAWAVVSNYYNAQQVHRWATKLVEISDDYTAQYDEACDMLNDTIG